jgi:DNA-directed RNA polymerase I subunit RPA49
MTKWFMDKFILHVCAMALHIDNFEVDTHDLMEDLQLTPMDMQKYYQELGCRVVQPTAAQKQQMRITPKEAATHKMARLQLPLEFPKVKERRGPPRR